MNSNIAACNETNLSWYETVVFCGGVGDSIASVWSNLQIMRETLILLAFCMTMKPWILFYLIPLLSASPVGEKIASRMIQAA